VSLEIDAPAAQLPIAVARGLGPFGTAHLGLGKGRHHRDGRLFIVASRHGTKFARKFGAIPLLRYHDKMNHNAIGAHSGRLPHLGLLRFTGADALGFLQGQISNDTDRLAQGRSLLCALSSAQGRVLAVMTLLPHSAGVIAIVPTDLLAPVAARLQKFVLRSKVRIEEPAAADLVVAGQHGPAGLQRTDLPVPQGISAYAEAQGIGVARLNDLHERYWVIGAPAALAALAQGDAARAEGDWKLADIRAGLPQVYAPTSDAFVAQMLNLDLVDGISFAKGCYTGQEIIARTQHLGRIKRRMFRVALSGAASADNPGIGAMVRLADGRSGRMTEIARATDGFEALAVLPLEATTQSPAGTAAALLTLPYEAT
jgi:tRNA-modifying protein YgfZ